MNYELRKNNKNSGFTLVETLIAISIFTTSILVLMSVLAQGITSTTYASQKLTATYLAQEGIEYMRNLRDTYVVYDPTSTQQGWTAFQTRLKSQVSLCEFNAGCYFDDSTIVYTNPTTPIENMSLLSCGNGPCPVLKYDAATGKYGYSSGVNSVYTRRITVWPVGNETLVTSTVFWTQGSKAYNVSFSENLFNWVE